MCSGIDTTGEVQQLLDKGATLDSGGKKSKKQRAVKAALPQLGLSNKALRSGEEQSVKLGAFSKAEVNCCLVVCFAHICD